jgi:putative oxidoreductase
MNVAATIARILLGILFTLAGASAFLISNPPPQPGLAGAFNGIFVHSHWALFVGAVQLAIGVLLLINRYVPLALIMLAAFLYNSFAFHITMSQAALPAPLIVLVLWLLVARRYRGLLSHLAA